MEFTDRNNFEIQEMVDLILKVARMAWSGRGSVNLNGLDQEQDFVEWGVLRKNYISSLSRMRSGNFLKSGNGISGLE